MSFYYESKDHDQGGKKGGSESMWHVVFLGAVSRPYDWRPWLTLLETDMISSMVERISSRTLKTLLTSNRSHGPSTLTRRHCSLCSGASSHGSKRSALKGLTDRLRCSCSQSAFCLQRKWCNRPVPLEWSERERGDSSRTACEAHAAVLGLFHVTHYHGSSPRMMSHWDFTPL